MPSTEDGSIRTVQAVDTAFRIIDTLQEFDGAGVTEIADHLDLSKGAVHGHLATMRQRNFVRKENGEYELSLKFLEKGEYLKDRIPIIDIAKPELQNLAEEHHARAQIVGEEHGTCVFLACCVIDGPHALAPPIRVGGRSNLHSIASGKAILAYLPEERIREIVRGRRLERVTEHTTTDPDQLLDELEEVRNQGFAFNDEESQVGLRAVGAPIRDQEGDVIAAVSVSMPVSRMDDERFYDEMPGAITNAANVIEINAQVRGISGLLD